jgi:L,D-peptidoglycan transpeptidase YkuD (ErfK/YbiS/YcfS/YnhG family)
MLRARELAMGSIDDTDVGVREGVREEDGDDLGSLSFFELNLRNMFMVEGCVGLEETSNVAMLRAAF